MGINTLWARVQLWATQSSGFECWDRTSSSWCLQVSQPQLMALGLQLSSPGKLEGACQ